MNMVGKTGKRLLNSEQRSGVKKKNKSFRLPNCSTIKQGIGTQ